MADVRWASLGWLAMSLAPLAMMGCSSDAATACVSDPRPDGSMMVEMRPPNVDAAARSDAPATVNGGLGSSCASTAACQTGLTCFKPTDNVGPGAGPPNGLCALECLAAADQAACTTLGGNCVFFGGADSKVLCMESCEIGPTRAPKCHGRLDAVCASLVDSTGAPAFNACTPRCTDDLDCGSRKCDLGSGFCTEAPTPGLPPGSPCAVTADCAGGFCANFAAPDAGSPLRACLSYCRYGQAEGCGFRRGPLTAGAAACAIPAEDTGADGDEGYCFALCDTNADCALKAPGWGCANNANIRSVWGHGLCAGVGAETPVDPGRDAATVDAARDATAGPREGAAPDAAGGDGASARDAGTGD